MLPDEVYSFQNCVTFFFGEWTEMEISRGESHHQTIQRLWIELVPDFGDDLFTRAFTIARLSPYD